MQSDSRSILILGLGDDRETNIVQSLTNESDTLWLEAPFADFPDFDPSDGNRAGAPFDQARSYFAGAPIVQTLRIDDAAALQRAVDAIAVRHGRLDMLIVGSHFHLGDTQREPRWQRVTHPYRFDWLAAIVCALPLLMRSSRARIVDLGRQLSDADLHPLLGGTGIRLENALLAEGPVTNDDTTSQPIPAHGAAGVTTL